MGDRLLDIGCGWGSMVRYAARHGVYAIGATLSAEQAEWAQKAIVDEGLSEFAQVRHSDYRDVPEGDFDAVSSIGLTEHIGVGNYPAYFVHAGQAAPGRNVVEPLHHPARQSGTATGRAHSSTDTSSPTAS